MTLANRTIVIKDNSHFNRLGLKGPNAQTWLASQGLKLPELPNKWVDTPPGGLVLRLGQSEFLVEDQHAATIVNPLKEQLKTNMQGIYPVARADAAFTLSGELLPDLFSEICLLDLAAETNSQTLLMTQLAGVSATILKQTQTHETLYRIWCDGTYHRYMRETLTTIAREIGDLESKFI